MANKALRDPRAFKVLQGGPVSFPKDDDVLASILRGDVIEEYARESYNDGKTIPGGRLPLSSSSALVSMGVVEAVGGAQAKPGNNGRATVAEPSKPVVAVPPIVQNGASETTDNKPDENPDDAGGDA